MYKNIIENQNYLFDIDFKNCTFENSKIQSIYKDTSNQIYLYQADCIDFMNYLIEKYPAGCFDMIFADPPYFLSNNGFTCKNGEMVSVNKGDWDKSRGFLANHQFNLEWLALCQKLLKPNGTLWVSGTMHVIYSLGFAVQELNYKILNEIIWEKPNPPPNLACRYFTHSTESIIWAAKSKSSKHKFNYELMKLKNDGKQMKSVWKIPPPTTKEKEFGKHPTQKPLALVQRCIESCTDEGDFVFDPFAGSCTTGVAALNLNRKFCGVDLELEYLTLGRKRLSNILI